jgi:hypothetical protein
MSRALPRVVAAILIVLPIVPLAGTPVAAQELFAVAAPVAQASARSLPGAQPLFSVPPVTAVALNEAASPAAADFSRIRRPAVLPALYVSTVVTQALDAHSTMKALGQGATEANPLMEGVAGNSGALLALKVGAAAGAIFVAERTWRRNRVAAIATLVIVNAVTAAVAVHNYSVASSLR